MRLPTSVLLAGLLSIVASSAPLRSVAQEPAAAQEQTPPAQPSGSEAAPTEGTTEKRRRVRSSGPRPTPEMIEAMRAARAGQAMPMPATGPTTMATTSPSTSPSTGPATTTAPTTGPATTTTSTSPSGVAPTPPFPKDYGLLLKRSMFARGAPKSDKPNGNPQAPEGNFGLRGVGVQDGQFVAFIEDSSSKTSKPVKQGEPIATGKVKSIDIDGIQYEGGGKTTKVAIGQNLLGAPLPPPPQPAPKPPEQPQGAQPGQPGQPGQPQPGQPGGPPQGRRR